eukprot:scaffold22263_cov71-Phaeocystis_antarctica.AAC.1
MTCGASRAKAARRSATLPRRPRRSPTRTPLWRPPSATCTRYVHILTMAMLAVATSDGHPRGSMRPLLTTATYFGHLLWW